MVPQHVPGVGECDAPTGSLKEGRFEKGFESLDLLRQGGLGDSELLRRAPEVERFGHRSEVSKMPEFDPPIHKFQVWIAYL